MENIECIFSITVHEELDAIKDLVSNIICLCKMNKKIIFHCSDNIYEPCRKEFEGKNEVIVNPSYWSRDKKPIALISAHIENFDLAKKNYKFDYFIWLASNCLFVKAFTLENIKNKEMDKIITSSKEQTYNGWHYPTFFSRDKNLMDILKDKNVEIIAGQHEGAVVSYFQMQKISEFIYENKFHEIGTPGPYSCLEEVVFPSLERHFSEDKILYRINKAFWECRQCTPNIAQIENCLNNNQGIYTVKRVTRKYNDPVRYFYRQKYGYTS